MGEDNFVMDTFQDSGARRKTVEVVESCGEWHVRVVADDREQTLTFELESYALVYAEGQRIRLGLADFTRL